MNDTVASFEPRTKKAATFHNGTAQQNFHIIRVYLNIANLDAILTKEFFFVCHFYLMHPF